MKIKLNTPGESFVSEAWGSLNPLRRFLLLRRVWRIIYKLIKKRGKKDESVTIDIK
jgi:hypothetical protein